MDKRAILFLIVSSTLVFAYMMVESTFAPPKPPNRNAEIAEQDQEDSSETDASQQDSSQDPANSSTDSDDNQPQEADDESENPTSGQQDADEGTPTEKPQDGLAANQKDFVERLVTLGSLAEDSPNRMLATLNSHGGTIHRLELNERLPNGRFRYKETDYPHGYLGNLEFEPTFDNRGLTIRLVGPGTPAANATPQTEDASTGLRAGDVLIGFNGEAINTLGDFEMLIEATEAGSDVELEVERGDQTLTYSATLTAEPLEILSPTDASDFGPLPHQESFVLRLGTLDRNLWREFETGMEHENWDTYVLDHQLSGDTEYYKSSPAQGSPPDGSFTAGTRVEVTESAGSYSHVRVDDGREGWVAADQLTPLAEREVAFTFWVSNEVLQKQERQGPIQVVKRYRLAMLPSETAEAAGDSQEADSNETKGENANDKAVDAAYHLEFTIELRNFSDTPQAVAFQLDGPTGAPLEGWWYANKIHGRSTAIGYSAGARDIIASSKFVPFRFLGGPEIYSNELDKGTDKRYEPLEIFPADKEAYYRAVNYIGVDAQYFTVALMPESTSTGAPFIASDAVAFAVHPISNANKKLRKKVDVTFRMTSDSIEVPVYSASDPNSSYRLANRVFAGPKEPQLLKEYGLQDAISYGWFAFFSKPLIWVLHAFYFIVRNYGLAIILLTVLVRACMMPISWKAVRNAQMMQILQPEMKKIAEKYKSDFEKRGQAQRELFKKYNYNPMGGCLLVFLQLPIFIGLYRGLSVDIALRDQPLIPGIEWCSNLAAPDKLLRWDSLPVPFLFSETGWLGPYLNVLPMITIVLFLVQQKLFTPPATDEQMKMTQKMMTYMMIFIGVMFFKVPAGLCIYFITSSLWGIAERKLFPKPKLPGNLAALPGGAKNGLVSTEGGGADGSAVVSGAAATERREQQKQRRKKLKGR